MNDFAERFSGDTLFKRVLVGVYMFGALFAAYMLTYPL